MIKLPTPKLGKDNDKLTLVGKNNDKNQVSPLNSKLLGQNYVKEILFFNYKRVILSVNKFNFQVSVLIFSV